MLGARREDAGRGNQQCFWLVFGDFEGFEVFEVFAKGGEREAHGESPGRRCAIRHQKKQSDSIQEESCGVVAAKARSAKVGGGDDGFVVLHRHRDSDGSRFLYPEFQRAVLHQPGRDGLLDHRPRVELFRRHASSPHWALGLQSGVRRANVSQKVVRHRLFVGDPVRRSCIWASARARWRSSVF